MCFVLGCHQTAFKDWPLPLGLHHIPVLGRVLELDPAPLQLGASCREILIQHLGTVHQCFQSRSAPKSVQLEIGLEFLSLLK